MTVLFSACVCLSTGHAQRSWRSPAGLPEDQSLSPKSSCRTWQRGGSYRGNQMAQVSLNNHLTPKPLISHPNPMIYLQNIDQITSTNVACLACTLYILCSHVDHSVFCLLEWTLYQLRQTFIWPRWSSGRINTTCRRSWCWQSPSSNPGSSNMADESQWS